jgi:hypothetical protein
MIVTPIAASTLGIVIGAVAVLAVLFLIGGLIAVRVRDRRKAAVFEQHVRGADAALEQARALDRGWDRELMEAAVHAALGESRPGFGYEGLHLVLVDDRPGTDEDRAHFIALGGDGEARVVLAREGGRWVVEQVE